MALFNTLLVLLIVQLLSKFSYGQPKPDLFRKDYTFLEESQAYYKVHTTRRSWKDAKKECQLEGASLFYPEDDVEAEAVMGLWNRTEPYGWIYLGVSSLLAKGVWETIDGRPLLDVYSNWGAGQPDDVDGIEDCVLWRRDKTLIDYTCHEEYPFICKKSLLSLDLDSKTEAKPTKKPKPSFDRKDYTFIQESEAFYKVHNTRKAFHDARMQCQKEGAILFYPEDAVEAEAVLGLWNRSDPYGWIYLGITDLLVKGIFETVDGRPLLDVYTNWGAGQPDDTGRNEDCVLWRRDKTFNDYTCHEEYPFICKKSLPSLGSASNTVPETKPTKKPKPSFDPKDYTFIQESEAFYKVHNTRKAFHDARMQCQKEGAILFYPEDAVEAEAVMGLWNRTEPYGWIYLGITDLLVKGTFETVDGRPLLDVYSNWGAGQPDDTGFNEDCVLWRRDKTFNDYTCHEEYPFICKKSLLSLGSASNTVPETKPNQKRRSGRQSRVYPRPGLEPEPDVRPAKTALGIVDPNTVEIPEGLAEQLAETTPVTSVHLEQSGVSSPPGSLEFQNALPNVFTAKTPKPSLDRKDYTFIQESEAFYKVHTTRKAFHDASMQCQKEGAILFYPEDAVEAEAVMGLWNRTEPYGWIYLGITDLLVEGTFETVDGRPLLDVYSNWGAGQPDNTGGNEDCVLWRRDKTLNDYTCHEEYPFICKKSLLSLGSVSNTVPETKPTEKPEPNFDHRDYTFIHESQASYKVHTTRKAFHDARMQCQMEGAILFYPEDSVEAEAVMGLWNRTEPYGWIYLGITDLLVKGKFETVDGRPLLDVYSNWGAGQPDDSGGNEDCVLWRRDKTLIDYTCHEEYPFICKKSLLNLGSTSNTVPETKPTEKPELSFDREDYTFIHESQASYKVHTTRKAFHDARIKCQMEGAILFYPENAVEAEAVMGLWNRTEPYGWIYLGITDLIVKGKFETVDGRPLLDVYSNWGAGQPDDSGGNEDCVLWRRDKSLIDYTCHEEYPFICKKSLLNLGSTSNTVTETKPTEKPELSFDREDYTFIHESQASYKVHTTRKAFHDARMQCQMEGAILFYPEDAVEAEAVMGLWNRTEPYGWIYLGITDLLVKGKFETVDGRPLLDVYSNWGAGQPDDSGGNEDCVLWRRDKTLIDYTCHEEYPFICKKSLLNLGSTSNTVTETKPTKTPQPSFDRKDYTFIQESQAFYKVHTTRKAFHEARMQCQMEGAILFYPEDAVEAEAVMGLWNRTEPFGWIYLGITDLLVKGTFETVDGRPLLDVYSNWGAGQPDDTGGNEDCVFWRRDKTLNDYTCHEEYPFICKKSLQSPGSASTTVPETKPIKKPKPSFDRKDYTFIQESQAFYKVHTTHKAFHDARIQCQMEGAILFYPEDAVEAEAVMGLWNRTEPFGWIYLGITDLLVKGTFETVDGRPLLDVYSNWGAGQPDDTGGNEDCVFWRRDKTFNDYTCHEKYPFICKKSLPSLDSASNTVPETKPTKKPQPSFDRKDYTFIQESQAFYKVHTTRKAFHDARMQCQMEGAILFYPENAVEAEVVMGLWNRTEPFGWIYLGITDLLVKGTFETVDGRPLLDVYSNWGAGQPDDTGGNEDCVFWRRDKTFNDYTCHEKYPFICKKSLLSLGSDTISETKPSVKPKPSFDCKDYIFIQESQAYYKVHTTRKAFHDARMECQKEGAILFYPEDEVEAEAVMGLWNRTEPYGWIYLGITDFLQKGSFETVDGRPLLDVYSNWGVGQPDNVDGIEDCVLWRRDKTLIDYSCHEEYPFICKNTQLCEAVELPNLAAWVRSNTRSLYQPRPHHHTRPFAIFFFK